METAQLRARAGAVPPAHRRRRRAGADRVRPARGALHLPAGDPARSLRLQGRGQPHLDRPGAPNRGLILDRNGIVMARNYSGYTLEIFPRKVRSIERTIDEVAELVEIQPRDRAPLSQAPRRNPQRREPADPHPPDRRGSRQVRGEPLSLQRTVEIKARLFRQYPYDDIASHVHRLHGPDQRRPIRSGSRRKASTRTTAAPTSSARPASRRATSTSCTARPASSRSRSTPQGAASARFRALPRSRATTSR